MTVRVVASQAAGLGAAARALAAGRSGVGLEHDGAGADAVDVTRSSGPMGGQHGVTLVLLAAPRRGRRTWTIKHNGRRYAVFDVNGRLEVTDAVCPHNGGPLAKGTVRGDVVTCPSHWYSFDLVSGRCLTAAGCRLRKYPVVQRDGRSFAELPAEPRPARWLRLPKAGARSGRAG